MREKIFAIANFYDDCQLSDFAQDQSDLKQFFTNITPQLIETAKEILVESKSTKLIKNVPWVAEDDIVTFRQKNCIISWEQCREILLDK